MIYIPQLSIAYQFCNLFNIPLTHENGPTIKRINFALQIVHLPDISAGLATLDCLGDQC